MDESLLNTIYLAGAFLLLFASAELLYHKMNVKAELTRKYVHIVTGLLTMLFPSLINNPWLVMALCGSFLVILLTSLALNLLPSINAVERVTRGSILYPIIVYGCYLFYWNFDQFIFYYIPILVLAICDPMAALFGRRWPFGKYKTLGQTKTLVGSLAFFTAAFLTCMSLIFTLEQVSLSELFIISIGVAFVTTIAEALAHNGYDNLTIPSTALAVLFYFSTIYSF